MHPPYTLEPRILLRPGFPTRRFAILDPPNAYMSPYLSLRSILDLNNKITAIVSTDVIVVVHIHVIGIAPL
jgi:hypothetical protein